MTERDEPTGALVRPYAVTRGRTRPKLEIALEALVDYAQSGRCRWRRLLEYFDDDEPWAQCGHCDNCRRPPVEALAEAEEATTQPVCAIKLPDIAPGSRAEVPKLGRGRVGEVAGAQVTIAFGRSGQKTFLRRYVMIID